MACEIRLASEADTEAISGVILTALHESNAQDYSPDIIARVAESFSPAGVRRLMSSRTVFVAVEDGSIVGTASLDRAVVRCARGDLVGLVFGTNTLDERLAGGHVKIDRDDGAFATFLGLLDRFDLWFPIVTP